MKRWMLAAGVAAILLAVGAGGVMAQSSGDTSSPTFLDRVAQKLGIDTPKLKEAITGARSDQIDEQVASGNLTQQQADQLKQRLEDLPNDFGAFGGHGFRGGFGGFGFGVAGVDFRQQIADYLGISTDQLQTELRATDATLATVAQAHGKSRDDLKSFLTDKVKAALDQAVANQDITQKNADQALQRFTDNLDTFVDSKGGKCLGGAGFGGMKGHAGDDDSGNGGTTTPQPQRSGGTRSTFRS